MARPNAVAELTVPEVVAEVALPQQKRHTVVQVFNQLALRIAHASPGDLTILVQRSTTQPKL